MNILFLVNELRYTCGVTNHLLHLSKGLSENVKNKIFIITGGGNGIERFDNLDLDVSVESKFLHENRSPVNYLSAVNILAKFVKQNKIDVIHSHSHYAANLASLASKIKHTPTVQTNHGLLQETGKLKHFTADKYVAINEHIYSYIIEHKIAVPADVAFIRCGIPVPDKPAAKKKSPIMVMAASRFTSQKGLDIYINAVSKISENIKSKAEFFLAGEGEEENNLKELNDKINGGVKFLDRVTDLPEVLKDNHIFVYTSRSKNEGFPAVITEAGANNNLLITSDFAGLSSVAIGVKDCLIFPVDDADKLAELISRSITEYSQLCGISERFYNKVKDLFDLGNMISKHEELYSKCLKA